MAGSLKGHKLALFDLETTGFYAEQNDQVTQIAAAVVDGDSLSILGEPLNLKAALNAFHMERLKDEVFLEGIQPGYQSVHWILALNGYHPLTRYTGETAIVELPREDETTFPFEYNVPQKLTKEEYFQVVRDIESLPSERKVLEQAMEWVRNSKATMAAGHNANNFDKPFLNFRLEEVYGMDPLTLGVLDTLWLARLTLIPAIYALEDIGDQDSRYIANALAKKKNPENLSSKLQDLRYALRIVGGLAHDAFGDITTNLAVLVAIMEFLKKKKDILAGLEKFEEYRRQAFVKHRDRGFKY